MARTEARVVRGRTQPICALCGGPRIPSGLGGDAAATALRQSKALDGRSMRARMTSVIFAVMTVLGALVLLAAWHAGFVVMLALFACTALFAALALRARRTATRLDRKSKDAQDEAWLAAVENVTAHETNGVTVHELAARLHIDEERADHLLTRLLATERTRIDVGDDAEVRYRTRTEIAPGLRVDDDALYEQELANEDDPARNKRGAP
ncbi:MAG: hypothetical protein FWD69_00875 [Polyangiaceae bacterium]|nr:hypothetical protein [Polyangiaceae bacterium]